MKYNDLEKTKELFDIDNDIPAPIDNIEMEGASKNNVTDEFTLGLTDKESEKVKEEVTNKEPKDKKNKKGKKSLKVKWQELSKKKKIIIIVILCLILIAILALILVLALKKEDEKPKVPKEPSAPAVIIEKENYIYQDGVLSLIDKDDNELGTYECKNKDEKLCYVAYFSDEDDFDTAKNVYEDESIIERRSGIYNNNYVFIYDNTEEKDGILILYNIKDQKEEGVYSLVKGYSDSNYVIVKDNNNKYGALEFSEDEITEKIKFTFDYLGMMDKDSKVVAKTNNKYFIYNKDGKLESKGLAYKVKSYNNNYVVVDNNGYYVYDYKGNLIFDESYDYIKLMDDYASLVKDNKLYIKDYKNQKYNEDGITLYNDYYNETNIYTKDKKLSSTKVAYKVNIVENNFEITYYNKNDKEKIETISINDGKLSSNIPYINYINGKLYFYKEEEKNTLLGSYTCSNKNNVDSNTITLNNCYIASDSFYSKNEVETDNSENLGWIPIFNERYVFIMDIEDEKQPNIVLYDLKDNKTLSKYISVDTGSYTKEQKVTFKTSANTYVMAESKSKEKYGVIKIEDEVKSAIGFEYDKIEKLRDRYMGKKSSGTYVLIDENGKEVTTEFGYPIVDYKDNYLKLKDGDKYYASDFQGKKDDTGYLYISLESDYYVVINTEKKLDIRKYSDHSFKLSTPIDIGDTDDYKNAFTVSKSNSEFIIKIKATGETKNANLSTGLIKGDTPSVDIPGNPENLETSEDNSETSEGSPETSTE